MSKKKSLGSSPIGHAGSVGETFDFIPSIPDAQKNASEASEEIENETVSDPPTHYRPEPVKSEFRNQENEPVGKRRTIEKSEQEGFGYFKKSDPDIQQTSQPEVDSEPEKEKSQNKKITSYSLEEDLIERIKVLANDREVYYSTVVSRALNHWLKLNGY